VAHYFKWLIENEIAHEFDTKSGWA